jgi:hypothetical protein
MQSVLLADVEGRDALLHDGGRPPCRPRPGQVNLGVHGAFSPASGPERLASRLHERLVLLEGVPDGPYAELPLHREHELALHHAGALLVLLDVDLDPLDWVDSCLKSAWWKSNGRGGTIARQSAQPAEVIHRPHESH